MENSVREFIEKVHARTSPTDIYTPTHFMSYAKHWIVVHDGNKQTRINTFCAPRHLLSIFPILELKILMGA